MVVTGMMNEVDEVEVLVELVGGALVVVVVTRTGWGWELPLWGKAPLLHRFRVGGGPGRTQHSASFSSPWAGSSQRMQYRFGQVVEMFLLRSVV